MATRLLKAKDKKSLNLKQGAEDFTFFKEDKSRKIKQKLFFSHSFLFLAQQSLKTFILFPLFNERNLLRDAGNDDFVDKKGFLFSSLLPLAVILCVGLVAEL